MKKLTPNLNILPPEQRELWSHLSSTPPEFILYGGTAIALRLGHRESIDFDFFSERPFNPKDLYERVPYLQGADISQRSKNTLTCFVKADPKCQAVKVSFFGKLPLKHIQKAEQTVDNHIKVASSIDLLGMKCATVIDRVEKKDYIDIHAILTQTPLTLEHGLKAARAIYGKQYNPLITLKALSYFEGGNLDRLDETVKNEITKMVKNVDTSRLINEIHSKVKKKQQQDIER